VSITIFGRVRIRQLERSTQTVERSEAIANRAPCWREPLDLRALWEQQLGRLDSLLAECVEN
jgi:hypothetical protein